MDIQFHNRSRNDAVSYEFCPSHAFKCMQLIRSGGDKETVGRSCIGL